MEPQNARTVTLMKETQCMPDSPEATVLLHSLRMNGELGELPSRDLKIEFVGDSLTSGEGSLAPRGNDEWITQWFSARGNYSWVACDALNAERRILSQSGWGVCWDWEHNPDHTLTAHYEEIAGVLRGPAAEKRGCTKPYDFAAWQPDIVCIRLGTNDNNGMNVRNFRPKPSAGPGRRAYPACTPSPRRIITRRIWVPASIPTRNGTGKPASCWRITCGQKFCDIRCGPVRVSYGVFENQWLVLFLPFPQNRSPVLLTGVLNCL